MAAMKAELTAGGGGDSFTEERLSGKLAKLSSSAASIQTLSNWCIFHRKRSKRIVDTWERQFNNATTDKKVSFLYLSNDILQNSKRKGGEFVNEFWRVLPGLLKDFYENGGEHGKKVVARLIGIWDERKVFGTRGESLKDMLGDNPPTLDNNGTSSNPSFNPSSISKSAQKDSSTTIKKLAVCGMAEKIATAYQSVLVQEEDTALNKCKTTVSVLEKMDKDSQQTSSLICNLQEQEAILKQCIEQLESVDAARITLINQLKEALSEQETKSELLRNQLQVARAETEHTVQLRQRFSAAHVTNGTGYSSSPLMTAFPSEQTAPMMQNAAIRPISPQFPPHLATSLPATSSAAVDESKKIAAAMADKLASLSSKEQVLSSILASLAAEQAASKNGGSPSVELSTGPPGFAVPKRPEVENPSFSPAMCAPSFFGQLSQAQQIGAPPSSLGGPRLSTQANQAPDFAIPKRPKLQNPSEGGDMCAPPFFGQLSQPQQIGASPAFFGGTQPLTQANQAPSSFAPAPLPFPPAPPTPLHPFSQNAVFAMGGTFGMMTSSMPPQLHNMLPPGFPSPSGPPVSAAQDQSQTQQQPSPQALQQSPTPTGFVPTSGIGIFPPVQVQQSPPAQQQ
ncbi:proline-rich protein 36 isoform X2 [Brachypodium distachyon]|uniref:CID domain-containing protein n=1 Tax=Brachypodium distachyon TaxID=15368 RepID=A0A0Q3HW10_BRADI|nr:proline-rich protein 36 isoform X2 [Brachypodium distachyon]KQJ92467.1 hypothetical protein BRADI_4g43827v3 [Brachypodium distachyon]|eukprot:XP_024310833.1 proline-rich protein 36 isoform X2 [Brachypodium distachyon]